MNGCRKNGCDEKPKFKVESSDSNFFGRGFATNGLVPRAPLRSVTYVSIWYPHNEHFHTTSLLKIEDIVVANNTSF